MKAIARTVLVGACLASMAGVSIAAAQPAPQRTPKGWTYDVDKRGNRIARNMREARPDGSWREEVRQGNCVTIKERSATGEYKESRQCNPGAPK
jgi:uncharacterized membrane protein